ncbi:Dynein light chain 1 cytoplasmic [Taenia solium]|eukprot:TsM_001132100 transcript=TsM_001132100 gene=TsM_001132100
MSEFHDDTDNMSDWLTDEFTAGALVAIADATRNNDKAKEIAISIKTQIEDHFEGPWQVIVGTDFASAITVKDEKFFYAKKNDFTIHIFKAG